MSIDLKETKNGKKRKFRLDTYNSILYDLVSFFNPLIPKDLSWIIGEYLDDNIQLKKNIACSLFLDGLQQLLEDYNDYVVKCGCIRCADFVGGNYPELEENKAQHANGCFNWISANGPMKNVISIKDCLLYRDFKSICLRYNIPVPEDNEDAPWVHPSAWKMTTCLGKGLGSKNPNRWRARVKKLSWFDQVTKLYPMIKFLYDRCNLAAEVKVSETFEDWFVCKTVSLI